MSATIEIRSAPHVKGGYSVEKIMRHVVYSLLPVCAFFVFQYGISALASMVVITATCLLTERFFVRTGTQSGSISDFSATITGLLLALSVPPGFPLWMGVVTGFIAIALGKALFGGIGFNVFNPALVGRAFAQAAFPTAIASYTASFLPGRFTEFIPSSLAWPLMIPPETAEWLKLKQLDALAGATPLGQWKFEGIVASAVDLMTSLGGHMAVGPSPLLIIACGAYLASRRFMDWRIPAAVISSAGLVASVLYAYNPSHFPNPLFTLFSGGLMLGAIYMATDMVTSPVTSRGVWIYGGLIGLLTVVIRYFSGLPEGVMYAILFANAAMPLIERISQPAVFGAVATKKARRSAAFSLETPASTLRESKDVVIPIKVVSNNQPPKS